MEVFYVVMWSMSCDSLLEMFCVKDLLWAHAGIQLSVVKMSNISNLMDHMIYESFIFVPIISNASLFVTY